MARGCGNQEWIELVGRETAKISWPGRMSGGRRPLLKAKAKVCVETFFAGDFRLGDLLANKLRSQQCFDRGHWDRVERLAGRLAEFNATRENQPSAISAKLVNTFFHQLMKYEDFRYLWRFLHLPLDGQIFSELVKKKWDFKNKASISEIIRKPPYTINEEEYHSVQTSLWSLVKWINDTCLWNRQLTSRIELNLLWIRPPSSHAG